MIEVKHPQILVFLVDHMKKLMTENHLYQYWLEKYTDRYTEYCKIGVNNPSQFEQDMIDLAMREAKIEYDNIKLSAGIIERYQIDDEELRKTIISIIENRKDFQKWVSSPHPEDYVNTPSPKLEDHTTNTPLPKTKVCDLCGAVFPDSQFHKCFKIKVKSGWMNFQNFFKGSN